MENHACVANVRKDLSHDVLLLIPFTLAKKQNPKVNYIVIFHLEWHLVDADAPLSVFFVRIFFSS